MREADYNRLRRAAEHLVAAATIIKNIKREHRTRREDNALTNLCEELEGIRETLEGIANEGAPDKSKEIGFKKETHYPRGC